MDGGLRDLVLEVRQGPAPAPRAGIAALQENVVEGGKAKALCLRPHAYGHRWQSGRVSRLFLVLIGERSIRFVTSNIVIPLAVDHRSSFVEAAGWVDDADDLSPAWLVSYGRHASFREMVFAVVAHAKELTDEEWRDQRYWIHALSANQFALDEEAGRECLGRSSTTMTLASPTTRGTLVVLSRGCFADTFVDENCRFEIATSFQLGYSKNLLIATEYGTVYHGGI